MADAVRGAEHERTRSRRSATRSGRRARKRRAWTRRSSSAWTASRVRSIVLLALARTQKVDLAKISVLALAEQYLGFIAACPQAAGWSWPPTIW